MSTVKRERVIRTAEKHVSKGRIAAAIKEYRKVLSDSPGDVSTLNRVGDLYARVQRFDEAVELFEQIARGYTGDGFLVKAIAIYKKIIKLDPTRLDVYEKLAELYHKQGLVNEARTQYQVLADYYRKHDKLESAVSIYRKMVQLEPDDPSHRVKLAELFIERKLPSLAVDEYRTIAETMVHHGHGEEALKVYVKALDLHPPAESFVRAAVETLRAAGLESGAGHFLEAAIARNKNLAPLRSVAPPVSAEADAAPEIEIKEAAVVEAPPTGVRKEVASGSGEIILDVDSEAVDTDSSFLEAAVPTPEEAEAKAADAPAESVAIDDMEEIELDLEEVYVLDLEDDEVPSTLVQPPSDLLEEAQAPLEPALEVAADPEASAPEAAEAPVEVLEELPVAIEPDPEWEKVPVPAGEIDAEFLERTAEEVEPAAAVPTESELLSEADVLAKYGLSEKAVERLHLALETNPESVEVHAQLVAVFLSEKDFARVLPAANRLSELAAAGDSAIWGEVRSRLETAGFAFEGERVTAVPPKKRKRPASDRITELLESLMGEVGAKVRKTRPPVEKPQKPPEAPPEKPAEAPPFVAAAAPEPPPVVGHPVTEEIALGGIFEEIADQLPAETPQGPATGSAEIEVSWLEDVDLAIEGEDEAGKAIFDQEEDFFDLAAELEQELLDEDLGHEGDLIELQEQSVEEIVDGFKQGVAEVLSPEDYETHFNLGIAYREMGLLDESIGEFQLAAKEPRFLIECCSMLGLCFQEKGLPELALKWYRRGLKAPELSEKESLGLLYDMGNSYQSMGDKEAAQKTFIELYGINSNYRDVVAKLEELR